ncbi:MAG: hypothetical protein IJJ99_06575 [Oscillospiraceae bacterium]|nr:hypothetical protein [Oscillospiraceae bacterium]
MNRVEITFQDILWTIKKYILWIVAVSLVSMIAAWVYSTYFVTPIYSTSISVCVFANERGTSSDVTTGELTADASIANTYQVLITSQPVMNAVSTDLGGKVSPETLRSMITATVQKGTQIINVYIRGAKPQLIADIGNSLAEVGPTVLNSLAHGGEMVAVDHAKIPTRPSSPNISSNTTVGLVLGLLLSCSVVILIALLDTTIWREEDLDRAFNIPILGSVPPMSAAAIAAANRRRRR